MSYYDDKVNELNTLLREMASYKKAIAIDLENQSKELELVKSVINKKIIQLKKVKSGLESSIRERKIGFPWLANAYDDLLALIDEEDVLILERKKMPAQKAADTLKDERSKRREAESELKIAKNIISYYEYIVPSLSEIRQEEVEDDSNVSLIEDFDDELLKYISKEEYKSLPDIEKNRLALERYWQSNKSKLEIGRMYERYVGYIYESQGYQVSYQGIFGGVEDLGRDLICSKDDEIILVQCKCWASFKKIYEKHIFQFFGTVFEYQDNYPNKKVRGAFITTTNLTSMASKFASKLELEVVENFKMDITYPCIKCNISPKTGEKIYHMPMDQQYDNVIIEPGKGEFYCATIEEAEKNGFRRAFKYKVPKN